jgi:signal peptidase
MARWRSTGRLLRCVVMWTVNGFVLAVLLSAALPLAIGDRSFVVRSGSMEPAIDTGDVVVVQPIAPASAAVGDIVTFEHHGKLTSHRARVIQRRAHEVLFTTQGDANTGEEHWKVAADGRVGRVMYRVPKLGFAVGPIQTPAGRLGLIILPALLLASSLMRRIWRGQPRPKTADALAS